MYYSGSRLLLVEKKGDITMEEAMSAIVPGWRNPFVEYPNTEEDQTFAAKVLRILHYMQEPGMRLPPRADIWAAKYKKHKARNQTWQQWLATFRIGN